MDNDHKKVAPIFSWQNFVNLKKVDMLTTSSTQKSLALSP